MKVHDLYRSVTDAIVAELEAGAVPWVRPWKGTNLMPTNAATKKRYYGINIPILWYSAEKRGYEHHLWLTYRQALEMGAQVRQGEHGSHIVYTSTYTKVVEDEAAQRRFLKAYTVFNISQIDGLPPPPSPIIGTQIERNGHADQVITSTGAVIHYGGNTACYIPSLDVVKVPKPDAFPDAASFYATTFHELGHFTAHPSRLDRDLKSRFGTQSYAAEELVAELCSAFLCASIGIQGELRHAGYIDNWIQLLKDADRAIFTASSNASRAADYVYGDLER